MRLRPIAGVFCALFLVIGATPAEGAVANAAPAAAAAGNLHIKKPKTGAAALAAQHRAATTGQEVVVEELTSPTEVTKAMPDGTLQYEVSSVPVRAQQGDEWVPVDLSLIPRNGWLEPEASAMPVRFSDGGSDTLAQVYTDGEWVSEVWPHGDLPVPAIDGDTATYANVLSDVDLKLVATRTGMATIYVVKSDRAAMAASLEDLHVKIEGAQIKKDASGAAVAETKRGAQLISGQPSWWDSSDGGTYREPGVESPLIPVTHAVKADRVSMDVGASVEGHEKKTSSEIVYPIFVDPDWSSGISASWYTDAAYPNQSYLSAGASDVLRVGIYGNYRSDMFFQFPLDAVAGKTVTSARLNTTQVAVASSGAGPIQVHTYGIKPAGFTWAQEQAWNAAGTGGWSAPLQAPFYGPGAGSAPMTVGWNVTSGVQAKLGQPTIQFAFTYTNTTQPSRRHYSRAATLIVSYNSLPNTPSNAAITSPPRACGTASAPAAVGTADVAVQVNQTDPDPGNVGTNFYLANATSLGSTTVKSAPLGAQGAKSATFTGLSNGVTYAWRARGQDATQSSAAYSDWCYFTVDLTKPSSPTITAPSGTTFTVGNGVNLSVVGPADGAGVVYWVTPEKMLSAAPAPPVPVSGTVSPTTALPVCNGIVSPGVRWACANGAAPASIRVAPVDSLSTLWVSVFDKAGNQSAPKGFPLYPNGNDATPAQSANLDAGHAWQVTNMNSPLPLSIPDSNPWAGGNAIALNIPSSGWASATDLVDPPLPYPVIHADTTPNPADEIWTDGPPVDASKSFTWSMWLKPFSTPQTDYPQKVAVQTGPPNWAEVSLRIAKNGPVNPEDPYNTPATYQFCIVGTPSAADAGRPVSNCAAGGTVVKDTWQMITGIWDADNQQLRLHVGNSIKPVSAVGHVLGSGDWSAMGPMVFAQAPDSFRYYGYIANPVALPGVVDHKQLAQMAGFMLPFSE